MFDHETLRLLWWLLLGVLLIGFAVTDGYDLGVGAILRLIARDDVERRMAIEATETHWEGHQEWLVLGGGRSSRHGRCSTQRRSRGSTSR